jgi:hypothetical protein
VRKIYVVLFLAFLLALAVVIYAYLSLPRSQEYEEGEHSRVDTNVTTPRRYVGVCRDLCGDGVCQEIVCMAVGCPCPETPQTCPQDCPDKPVLDIKCSGNQF